MSHFGPFYLVSPWRQRGSTCVNVTANTLRYEFAVGVSMTLQIGLCRSQHATPSLVRLPEMFLNKVREASLQGTNPLVCARNRVQYRAIRTLNAHQTLGSGRIAQYSVHMKAQ